MAVQGEVTPSLMEQPQILRTAVSLDNIAGAPVLTVYIDRDATKCGRGDPQSSTRNSRSARADRTGRRIQCDGLHRQANHQNVAQNSSAAPKRDINAVLSAHDKDRRTPCLKVMLERKNPETEQRFHRLSKVTRLLQK